MSNMPGRSADLDVFVAVFLGIGCRVDKRSPLLHFNILLREVERLHVSWAVT